jgi:hypothetical protein
MFRKFLYYFFILTLSLTINSCNKETKNLHRIKFVLEFLNTPNVGSSNGVEILDCEPHYPDEEVKIYKQYINSGYVWEYEYWEMVQEQEVIFKFWCQNDYHFIMRVFIDDTMVSYKEMVGLDESGVNYILVSQWGVNNGNDNLPEIKFTYYE